MLLNAFLSPSIVTPPLKNVRRRRFRKTLKKKVMILGVVLRFTMNVLRHRVESVIFQYAEAPETEKEVKRLFRVDNEAVSVRWEIVTGEEETGKGDGEKGEITNIENIDSIQDTSGTVINTSSQSLDIGQRNFPTFKPCKDIRSNYDFKIPSSICSQSTIYLVEF